MDDGALRTDLEAFRLHTQGFCFEHVCVLQATLASNYGISSKLHKKGKGHTLHIGSSNSAAQNFSDIIRPIISLQVPTMLYKLF